MLVLLYCISGIAFLIIGVQIKNRKNDIAQLQGEIKGRKEDIAWLQGRIMDLEQRVYRLSQGPGAEKQQEEILPPVQAPAPPVTQPAGAQRPPTVVQKPPAQDLPIPSALVRPPTVSIPPQNRTFCSTCGHELAQGGLFCAKCGKPTSAAQALAISSPAIEPPPAPKAAPPSGPPAKITATVPVTVASKQMETGHGGSAIYYITFCTPIGVKRKVLVTKETHAACSEGDTGTLIYEDNSFSRFEREQGAPEAEPKPVGPSSLQTEITSSNRFERDAAAPKPVPPPAPEPGQAASPVPPPPPVVAKPQAPAPEAEPARPAVKEPKRRDASTRENMFGRNVMGIAASVLVFIGLISFGVLMYDRFTTGFKILLMFLGSAVLLGVGVFLSAKSRNAFTKILTGCGCGSFFISIMVTHLYFEALGDIAAFSLILAWLAGALYLARRFDSASLSIVAHIGMVLSICFAYALSLPEGKLVLLLVYQAASIAVIVAGNLLCYKRTYRFGLFVSLALTIVASGCMLGQLLPMDSAGLPVWLISGAFIVQFVFASFLSCLLTVSANTLESETWRRVIHIGNKALWIAALSMNIYTLVYQLAEGGVRALTLASAAGSAAVVAHVGLTLFMRLKRRLGEDLEILSVLMVSGLFGVWLAIPWAARFVDKQPGLLLLLLPAALLLAVRRFSPHKAYVYAANVFLALDLVSMFAGGYSVLAERGTIALPIGYMLLYSGFLWLQWRGYDRDGRIKHRAACVLASYFVSELSLIYILLTSSLEYKGAILLLVMAALHIPLSLARMRMKPETALYQTFRANELLWVVVATFFVAFSGKDGVSSWLCLGLVALAGFLALTGIKENLLKNLRVAEEALYMMKIALLLMGTVYGYTSQSRYCPQIMLLTITALSVAFYVLRFFLYRRHNRSSTEMKQPLNLAMRINEFIWVVVAAFFVAFSGKDGVSSWLCLGLVALAGLPALTGIKENLLKNLRVAEEALYMMKIALLLMGIVYGYTSQSSYCPQIMLLTITALSVAFYVLRFFLYRYHKKSFLESPLNLAIRIYEFVWVAVDICFIAFSDKDAVSNVLCLVLAALAAALAFARARDLFTAKVHPMEELLSGIQLTGLAMAVVYGHTEWFANTYAVSLVCMLTALACIIVGFICRAKTLRLYGLTLTLLCVLKLVTYDVAGLDDWLRVISLISGGVICFLISAIYSYSAKKIGAPREGGEETDGGQEEEA